MKIKENIFESLNGDQRTVLNYMDEKRIGAIFFDKLQLRIWPVEIRSDKKLAEKIMLEKTEIGDWAYKKYLDSEVIYGSNPAAAMTRRRENDF